MLGGFCRQWLPLKHSKNPFVVLYWALEEILPKKKKISFWQLFFFHLEFAHVLPFLKEALAKETHLYVP